MMSFLDQIDTMTPWIISHERCPVCKKTVIWFTGDYDGMAMCKECFQKSLEVALIRESIGQWTWELYSVSLSSLGFMKDRLLALIHFAGFQTMERLPGLLVENLGFDSAHPLAWYVRQKAYEACCYFPDNEKILETIQGLEKYGSWQQKANMVKVVYELAPNNPGVQQFIARMVADISPNVRSHVADTIRNDKKTWAKALFQKLWFDKNPLVREACQMGIKNPDASMEEKISQRTRQNSPFKMQTPSYNRTEMMIKRYCAFAFPEKVYELYLSHVPDLLDKKEYDANTLAALKMNTKDACVRLLAAAVSDDFLFNTILEKLPRQVVMLLYMLVWEFEAFDTQTAAQKLSQIMDYHGADLGSDLDHNMPLHEAVKKDPAYFMFQTDRTWGRGRGDAYSISINDGLHDLISEVLPAPDFKHMEPVPEIQGRGGQIHENKEEIFRQLPVILSFIAQGNLKFAKNGKKILQGSLKKMAMACRMDEFYTHGDRDLDYLKTNLLAHFFSQISSWKPKDLEDLPGFIKDKINGYFSFKEAVAHRSRSFFGFIKRQLEEFDLDHYERQMRQNFKKILSLLPEGEWISTINIARVAFYGGIDFNPFLEPYEFDGLNLTLGGQFGRLTREKEYIRWLSTYDVMTLPYVKAMMFLMGAMGIVDLGVCPPKNKIFRQPDKSWLTVYDGLQYVRLTGFGSYVMGPETHFTHGVTIQSAKIEIDEHKTMLSIFGEDAVKQMVLAAVGQPINRASYMVNYQSFLKDCTTRKDVENKIQFFRDTIAETPPRIWEDFFKGVLARMNPLESVQGMSVFRVKPDRELLRLLTTDKILKKYVIRAENHHMLVPTSDFSKVKKRLAFFGFFIS